MRWSSSMNNVFLPVFISALLLLYHPAFTQKIIDNAVVDVTVYMSASIGQSVQTIDIESILKGPLTRIDVTSPGSVMRVIMDNNQHTVTTLIKSLGKSIGYIESEQALDSLSRKVEKDTEISYFDDSTQIIGYSCKKAEITVKQGGISNVVTVWYTPEFKFRSNIGLSIPGINKINGAPLKAITSTPQGITATYNVVKIKIDNKISDQLFVIPKEYEIIKKSDLSKSLHGG